jgi:hypothetical protein
LGVKDVTDGIWEAVGFHPATVIESDDSATDSDDATDGDDATDADAADSDAANTDAADATDAATMSMLDSTI